MSEENKEEKAVVEDTQREYDEKPTQKAIEMIDEFKSPLKPLKLRNRNMSNLSFIIILAYMIGMAVYDTYGNSFGKTLSTQGLRIAYLLLPIIVGNLLAVFGWFLGKIIGGGICGYELSFLTISGITYSKHRDVKSKNGKVKHWYLNTSYLLELHATFSPKGKKTDVDPKPMLIGSLVGILVAFAALLAIGLALPETDNSLNWLKYGSLFSAIHSIETLIYQILPFRQDYPNDMYTLISTRNVEDREAFNIFCIDTAYEFADEDLLAPTYEFSPDSYWKCRALIYKYINTLYKADVPSCYKILSECHQAYNYFNEEEKAYVAGECLFILLLLDDKAGADMFFTGLKPDTKKSILKPYRLSTYRNSFLVKGLVVNREEDAVDAANKFYKMDLGSNSLRFRQEKRYFEIAKKAVLKTHPKYHLPEAPQSVEESK